MNNKNQKNNRKTHDTFARRVVPAVTLIGASGALLAALDRPSTEIDVTTAGPPIAAAGTATTVVAGTTQTAGAEVATTIPTAPVVADPSATQPTAVPADAGNAATVETTAAPVVVETTATPPATPECGGSILGPSVSTKFGPVQVQASVASSGYVCSAQGVVWPDGDRRSVNINNQAIPLLDQWAAYQHDASFNSISGATYTSRAYKQSLQSIIDQVVAGG